jgi:adenosylmethionine-8-amino-7-oxononanoate aminotransferase
MVTLIYHFDQLMLDNESLELKQNGEPVEVDPFIKALGPACLERGALVRVQGHRMLLSSPLIFTFEAADEAFDALDGATEAVAAG